MVAALEIGTAETADPGAAAFVRVVGGLAHRPEIAAVLQADDDTHLRLAQGPARSATSCWTATRPGSPRRHRLRGRRRAPAPAQSGRHAPRRQFVDALGLVVQLAITVPLYGAAAVLIRELTRRAGRGWPTKPLLAAAFGLVQAGLVHQGLFNPHYVDDPSWAADRRATLVPGPGLSVSFVLTVVVGHVLRTFGA